MGKPKNKKPQSQRLQGKEKGDNQDKSTKTILLITAIVNLINALCNLIQKLAD